MSNPNYVNQVIDLDDDIAVTRDLEIGIVYGARYDAMRAVHTATQNELRGATAHASGKLSSADYAALQQNNDDAALALADHVHGKHDAATLRATKADAETQAYLAWFTGYNGWLAARNSYRSALRGSDADRIAKSAKRRTDAIDSAYRARHNVMPYMRAAAKREADATRAAAQAAKRAATAKRGAAKRRTDAASATDAKRAEKRAPRVADAKRAALAATGDSALAATLAGE